MDNNMTVPTQTMVSVCWVRGGGRIYTYIACSLDETNL